MADLDQIEKDIERHEKQLEVDIEENRLYEAMHREYCCVHRWHLLHGFDLARSPQWREMRVIFICDKCGKIKEVRPKR